MITLALHLTCRAHRLRRGEPVTGQFRAELIAALKAATRALLTVPTPPVGETAAGLARFADQVRALRAVGVSNLDLIEAFTRAQDQADWEQPR